MSEKRTEPSVPKQQNVAINKMFFDPEKCEPSQEIVVVAQELMTWRDTARITHGSNGALSDDAKSQELLTTILGEKDKDTVPRLIFSIVNLGRTEEEINERNFSAVATSVLVLLAYYAVRGTDHARFFKAIDIMIKQVHEIYKDNHMEQHPLWRTREGEFLAFINWQATGQLVRPQDQDLKRAGIIKSLIRYGSGEKLAAEEKQLAGIAPLNGTHFVLR